MVVQTPIRIGGVSRWPGQRRENLSGRTSAGAKDLGGHRRVARGIDIIPPALLATEAYTNNIYTDTRWEVATIRSLLPITR